MAAQRVVVAMGVVVAVALVFPRHRPHAPSIATIRAVEEPAPSARVVDSRRAVTRLELPPLRRVVRTRRLRAGPHDLARRAASGAAQRASYTELRWD